MILASLAFFAFLCREVQVFWRFLIRIPFLDCAILILIYHICVKMAVWAPGFGMLGAVSIRFLFIQVSFEFLNLDL